MITANSSLAEEFVAWPLLPDTYNFDLLIFCQSVVFHSL